MRRRPVVETIVAATIAVAVGVLVLGVDRAEEPPTDTAVRFPLAVDLSDDISDGDAADLERDGRNRLDPGPVPDDVDLDLAVIGQARRGVVRVAGRACGQDHVGAGFVIAPGLIATNAHVVAGLTDVTITGLSETVTGRVVGIDAEQDTALVSAPLDVAPLETRRGDAGEEGAVFGAAATDRLHRLPFRIDRPVTINTSDIYRQGEVERDGYLIAVDLAPGDSGGAMIGADGRVLGVVWAASRRGGVGYGITIDAFEPLLDGPTDQPVDTGNCA